MQHANFVCNFRAKSKTMRHVAVITGAGSGIGRAVASKLGANGYDVVLAGRRVAELEETAQYIFSSGATALVHPTDVTVPDQVNNLFSSAANTFGRVDLLFNNAGANVPAIPFDELRFEDWNRVVGVNLTGAFLCAQQAFRFMKSQQPQGGRIINNGSVSAHVPRPNSAAYTAAKHAITGLTKSLSLDGRRFQIACGQIDIGNAATQMSERISAGVAQANGTVMSEPMMDVEHVADAVLYMANLPLSANVQFMTVLATGMPFIGRG